MLQPLLLVVALTTVTIVAGQTLNHKVEYDKSFNLTCVKDKMLTISATQQVNWILPNGDLISRQTINHKRVKYLEQGVILHIRKVDDDDFGSYICLIYNTANNQYMVIKKGINMDGPYWGDLTAKYRQGIIAGAIAAAVVCVAMIGVCYLLERNPVLVGRDSNYMTDMKTLDTDFHKDKEASHVYDNHATEFQDAKKQQDNLNGSSQHVEIAVIDDIDTKL